MPLAAAVGRVLAAPVPLAAMPPHPTAAIDGVAVRAAATEGASDYAPLPIQGKPVRADHPMPPDTDAVLPPFAVEAGAALATVGRGANVLPAGHDFGGGATLPAGTRLRPLHLALLPGDPVVHARLRVAAPPDPSLHALLSAAGAHLVTDAPGLVLLTQPPARWTLHADALAVRPGEATALGLLDGTPAILLPRRPADAATILALLVTPLLRAAAGLPPPPPRQARLTRKIASPLGLIDAVRVAVDDGAATPLGPADSTGLLAACAADGLVLVPEGSEGYPPGAMVPIFPL